eukprot:3356206-Amphidinium_carterae.1
MWESPHRDAEAMRSSSKAQEPKRNNAQHDAQTNADLSYSSMTLKSSIECFAFLLYVQDSANCMCNLTDNNNMLSTVMPLEPSFI